MEAMVYRGTQQYQRSNVTLAPPATLIVLLYGELLCCLTRAKESTVKGDMTAQRKNTTKAIQIVTGLMISLNMEKGEDVAWNLALLYEHIAKRLLQAGRDPTPEPFDEAIRLLTPLKEAWETIAASPALEPSSPLQFASITA